MEVRFIPALGGNGQSYAIEVMNDTGSDMLSLFFEDLQRLGYPALPYFGYLRPVRVRMANGSTELLVSLMVEIRLLRPVTLEPWGPWIIEQAIV